MQQQGRRVRLTAQVWDPTTKRVDGVINDAAGRRAMDLLVRRMRPLTAPAWSSDWVEQVNRRINQGEACIGFNWLTSAPALLDPRTSRLGRSKDEILARLGFAPVPGQVANPVPRLRDFWNVPSTPGCSASRPPTSTPP